MQSQHKVDVLLVGGGIMSATLASLLSQLDDSLSMAMVEQRDTLAEESSKAWHNAGTGHAGYCELNYTPVVNSKIQIGRAVEINQAFNLSLQFWASLVEQGCLATDFIRPTPHISLVWNEQDGRFLRERYNLLKSHWAFADMEYSDTASTLLDWIPLIAHEHPRLQKMAATRVGYGSDIDFGALTHALVKSVLTKNHFALHTNYKVAQLHQNTQGRWQILAYEQTTGEPLRIDARFVFLGAGGAALPLLQKSGCSVATGYGGFPVSGQWLVCTQADVVRQHTSKVYGMAPIGAPPLSVPHLDTRYINGKSALLFGPYAGLTSKFLRSGSALDLFKSIRQDNFGALLRVACQHTDLTRYLLRQTVQSHQARMTALRQFYPQAKSADWQLQEAGKRVQIIKTTAQGGELTFGTELIFSADNTLATLLGASPGASTSVSAMLKVLQRCFQHLYTSSKLTDLLHAYVHQQDENPATLQGIHQQALHTLGLIS